MVLKLNNKNGASLLIALVVFLVATMVSVVIISASLTAVKRVHDDERERQNLLAVSSAARILSKEVSSTECTLVETVTDTNVTMDSNFEMPSDPDSMDSLLYEMCNTIKSGGTYNREYTMNIEDSSVGIPECVVSIKMDSSYNISGRITMVPETGELDDTPKISFTGTSSLTVEDPETFEPVAAEDDTVINVKTVTTRYNWAVKMYTASGDDAGE